MDKKKKRRMIILIVCLVVVIAAIVALVIYGNRSVTVKRFDIDNTDNMSYNPFVDNEERSDNSLLEYGKVLSKYGDKYSKYTGEDIVITASSFDSFGFTYNSETVTVYVDSSKTITTIGYKGKTYSYESCVNGEQAFATEDFINAVAAAFAEVYFTEDYTFEYYKDLTTNRDEDGYTTAAEPSDRYETLTGVISADSAAVQSTGDKITYTYTVEVPETALYSLDIEYFLKANRANSALMTLKVNGKLPFSEAENLELKRTYGLYDVNSLDVAGNEIRSSQQELFAWKTVTLSDSEGTYRNPFRFVLNAGTNTISITLSVEPVVIKTISLVAPIDSDTYDEYLAANNFSQSNVVTDETVQVEFETPIEKSNTSIRMEWDGDYLTSPASYKVTRYNYFGGDRWSTGGESATWSFSVSKTGWYKIGFRYQTTLTDIVSYREIEIDGEVPFEEMEEYCFPYSDGWIGMELADTDGNAYYFYLTAGEHTITITSKLGPLREAQELLTEAMESISSLVSKVVSITGAVRNSSGGYTVDKNRDWDLDKYIMGIQELIDSYYESFDTIYEDVKEANGGVLPYYGSSISVARNLFKRLASDLEDIPTSLNDINTTLSNLSTSLSNMTEEPLAIDYMIVTGGDFDYSKVRTNSGQSLYVSTVQFADSFTKDYTLVGARETNDDEDATEIEVYVARGREYVEMLRNLIAEDFTPNTGIKVNVNMVSGGVEGLVMLRYVTGTAPDVAISVGAGSSVEYAARGALVAFNDMDGDGVDDNEDFYEVKNSGSYLDDAFLIGQYRGNYYSFPETQSWSALFYRTDILEELGLSVPDTWDDVYEMLSVLNENGYDFCYNYGVGNLYPFIYQHDAEIYDYNGLVSALDTDNAYDAFVEYANLYNKYNIPYAANFYMRFKMGSMPIGIADVGTFCQLKYSAPEIDGKWGMAAVPGHVDENGDVVRYVGGSATSCIMIKNTNDPQYEAAWEFIKWWMSDDVQTDYANEVEATFGIGSRWTTANVNAVKRMAYTDEELAVIEEQWSYFKETPVVLGGYYTSRYLLTALNKAVIQGTNARIAVEDAVREINKEMKRKQDEFFPDGVDSVVWSEYKVKEG